MTIKCHYVVNVLILSSFIQSWCLRLKEKWDFFFFQADNFSCFAFTDISWNRGWQFQFWYEMIWRTWKHLMCIHEPQREWDHHYYYLKPRNGTSNFDINFSVGKPWNQTIRVSYRKYNIVSCKYRTNYDGIFRSHCEISHNSWLLACCWYFWIES